MIEDRVHKLLEEMEYELTHGACIVDKNRVTKEICQLFEPKPDEGLSMGIGNVLQLMCWNLVSDSIGCSGKMCNEGKGSNRLCSGLQQHLDQIRTKVASHYQNYVELDRVEALFDSETTHCTVVKNQSVEECYVIPVKDWKALRMVG